MIKKHNIPNNLNFDIDFLNLSALVCVRFSASDFEF